MTFSGTDPLPWTTRVQIALDSARGLEYIHEHTVPVYIHRDIKSANILIDKNYHAKVVCFTFFFPWVIFLLIINYSTFSLILFYIFCRLQILV